jgi:hypothetical protein
MEGHVPTLRFQEKNIRAIARRYDYPIAERELIELKPIVYRRGFLEKHELQKIAYWKAPRSSGHITKNSEEYVSEITHFALQAETEQARKQQGPHPS